MLLQKIKGAMDRLSKAEAAREGVDEAEALEGLRKELVEKTSKIHDLAVRYKVLRREGVSLSPLEDIEKIQQAVANVVERFREDPSSSTLKGTRWTSLNKRLEELNKTIEHFLLESWRAYFTTHLFAGSLPYQLKTRLAHTPENVKALARYTELFNNFILHKATIPANCEAIQEVRRNSEELAKIKFDESVPEEVGNFFEAVASNTGASLELLTPTVFKWLRDNNLLGNYVARARIH